MARVVDSAEVARVRDLEADAEAGDLNAIYLLGVIAASGTTVSEPQPARARELHAWASWHGHIDSTFEYSLLLRTEQGGPPDIETADRLERVAAEAGHPRACLQRGDRIRAKEGDAGEAIRWYERAAQVGNNQAAVRLIELFLQGDAVPRDEARARKWFVHALIDGGALFEAIERLGSDASLSERPEPVPSPIDEHRRLLGALLDNDASEVFDKLEQLLDTAPQLGEALLLEMAGRRMDLRGAISLLRDRVERAELKSWIQAAGG